MNAAPMTFPRVPPAIGVGRSALVSRTVSTENNNNMLVVGANRNGNNWGKRLFFGPDRASIQSYPRPVIHIFKVMNFIESYHQPGVCR